MATEKATLAGGCFWGMEEILRKIPGIQQTTVGYTGGRAPNPQYKLVSSGQSGHAESIQIVFDNSQITFADILEKHFFRMHDPTTKDQQGNDKGNQYRSVIFYHSEDQKQIAEKVKTTVEESRFWGRPIVTEIVPAQEFFPAEEYHQDYLEKNPGGYTCHYVRPNR